MSSPLEKLRAIARNANVPDYERNERNEITPPSTLLCAPTEGLLSFNSFLSYPETFAKQADGLEQPKVEGLDDIEERAALVEEGAAYPGLGPRDIPLFAQCSRRPVSRRHGGSG
jgi:hypothetical protein